MPPSRHRTGSLDASRSSTSGVAVLTLLVVAAGVGAHLSRDRTSEPRVPLCDAVTDACGPEANPPEPRRARPPTLTASDACRDAGYLCVALETAERLDVRRRADGAGTLVIHVPLPDFEDPALARALQRAASAGVRVWNQQPFPVRVDERGTGGAEFSVRWRRTLGGNRIGRAHTRWAPGVGLTAEVLELATRHPFDPDRPLDPRQVRLVAAHEVGHALGLGHSDEARDVMYPVNTAPSLSAQDFKTLRALYAMEDGAVIVP